MDSREPGRELDALVAEKVFGWTKATIETRYAVGVKRQKSPIDRLSTPTEREAWFPPGKSYDLPIPEYSTSLAAAKEILKKYEGAGHWWQINTPTPGGIYVAVLFIEGQYRAYNRKSAVSIAHAVCLAALAFEEEKRK